MANRVIPYNQLGKAGYNRDIRRAWVNKIKSDYREDMVQPAIVSFRDGKYWIVDGQHRAQAKYELNGNDPNTPILCDVRTGLTYEEEADLFHRYNNGNIVLTKAEDVKAMIEAKDATAVAFRDLVESCGYVMYINTSNSISAVSTIWKIFNKKNGEETLRSILSLTNACWPCNKKGVHSILISGIELFLKYHGDEFSVESFVKNLSKADPNTLLNDAVVFYKQTNSRHYTRTYCTYIEIIGQYNTGLRSNKLTLVPPIR